jgi:hypothetical protein
MSSIKYSKYLQETSKNYRRVRFGTLDHPPGEKRLEIAYTLKEALTIIRPYVKVRLNEQFKVVIPIALYLLLFQIIVMKQTVTGGLGLGLGLVGVVVGLMFFMEGLKKGLMPFGEDIGYYLPMKAKKAVILVIAFMLGIGATFAEPAMGVLKEAGKIVDPLRAPLLYAMLNQYSGYTVLAVSIGVGMATLLGILMFIYGWSLKVLIYFTVTPTLLLTAYSFTDESLSQIIGLAWDCGAVTTGPVTVPLVLSLGIGVASVIKHKHTNNIPGFGLVTLASMYPIMAVLVLGVILNSVMPGAGEQISMGAAVVASGEVDAADAISLFHSPSVQSFVLSVRAIVPLALFLWIVQTLVLRERIHKAGEIIYGLALCLIGMSLFNLGLNFGLSPLGSMVGSVVPASYSSIEMVSGSPLYGLVIGLVVCFLFAFFLGYGATLAEPALNALGLTVENITNGAFRKKLVMLSVSFGVAIGLAVGVLKIVFNISIIHLLLPLYILAIVLTVISEEKYVNMGWDSAGVTTGPITVPLVLAMGLGFANATNAMDGFGILALASIFPILSVLSVGLYVHYLQARSTKEDDYA